MNATVELNLTLILFLPWFAILGALYWWFPRQPRDPARRRFDLIALILAVAVVFPSMHWSFHYADPTYGRLWQQVLATAVSYGMFLAVLSAAFALRHGWLRRRHIGQDSAAGLTRTSRFPSVSPSP